MLADFVLTTEAGVTVKVGDLLHDRTKWNGTRFADPLEPGYHSDPRIAKAFLLGPGRPCIFSFAHGGRTFTLHGQSMLIRLGAGERSDYMDRICRKFDEIGEFYERDGTLVAIGTDFQIGMVNECQALRSLDRTFRFKRFSTAKKASVPADAPFETARLLVGAYASHFPKLRAVLTARSIVPATWPPDASDGQAVLENVTF